jgi:Papain fold toxin 2
LVWLVLAIIGAAADVATLNSALKAAETISKFSKEFNTVKDAELLKKQLSTIEGLDVKVQANIAKQAKIQEQEEKFLQGMREGLKNKTFVTIPFMAQTGELLARAVFAVRKGILSFEKFIDELKLTKVISDTGLSPEDLLIVKNAFEQARKAEKIGNAIFENTKEFHKNLQCVEAFNKNVKFIKQQGKSLEIKEAFEIHVDVSKKARKGYIDYLGERNPLIREHEAISENGMHKAVEIDGFIYDNVNPNGVSSQEWFSQMMYFDKVTGKPTLIERSECVINKITF